MKLTLILLFAFGIYSTVFSQQKFNVNSIDLDYQIKSSISEQSIIDECANIQLSKSIQLSDLKIDSTIFENWDYNYFSKSKSVYTYELNSETIIGYRWDSLKNEWIFNYKSHTKHQDLVNYRKQEKITYSWNESTSLWEKSDSSSNINETINNELHIIQNSFSWNNTINQWIPRSKSEGKLDSLGIRISSSGYNWNNQQNNWYGIAKIESNREDTIYHEYYFNWDYETNDWDTNYYGYSEKIYNISWQLTEQYNFHYYTPFDSILKPYYKTEYLYDIDGKNYETTNYKWDLNANKWIYYSKEIIETDESNNTYRIEYVWDTDGKDWIYSSKREYISLENGLVNVYNTYYWNNDINDWELKQRSTIYYSEIVTNKIDNPINTDVHIFPNPTNEALYFNLNQDYNSEITLEIFNVNGKKIYSGILEQNSVSTAGFENGMYFYHLTTDEKSFTGKFIVQH